MIQQEFDIDEAIIKIREAVRPFPPAAMFQLADEGYDSAFEQLIACIISIRTYDEVSIPVAHRLFARARTAVEMAALSTAEIAQLIKEGQEVQITDHQTPNSSHRSTGSK